MLHDSLSTSGHPLTKKRHHQRCDSIRPEHWHFIKPVRVVIVRRDWGGLIVSTSNSVVWVGRRSPAAHCGSQSPSSATQILLGQLSLGTPFSMLQRPHPGSSQVVLRQLWSIQISDVSWINVCSFVFWCSSLLAVVGLHMTYSVENKLLLWLRDCSWFSLSPWGGGESTPTHWWVWNGFS